MSHDINNLMNRWREGLLAHTEILYLLICINAETTDALHQVQKVMQSEFLSQFPTEDDHAN